MSRFLVVSDMPKVNNSRNVNKCAVISKYNVVYILNLSIYFIYRMYQRVSEGGVGEAWLLQRLTSSVLCSLS